MFMNLASVGTKSGQYPRETWKSMWSNHKVLTYIEYRALSGVFRTNDPPPHPLSTQRLCPPPTPKAGGDTHRAVRGWGGGNISVFWKTADIGLASYSIIPLREQQQCDGQKPHRGADRRHHAPQALMPRLADHQEFIFFVLKIPHCI